MPLMLMIVEMRRAHQLGFSVTNTWLLLLVH